MLKLLTGLAVISDCGKGLSQFQLTTLGLTPTSPLPGENTTMTVKFFNPGPVVTDGTVTTSVTYNYIPFTPTTEPLCANTVCPIELGNQDRSATSPWPDVSGVIQTHIEWNNSSSAPLLCIDVEVTRPSSQQASEAMEHT